MVYLDNAATTFPKPDCIYARVDSVQRTIAVNVGRGSYHAASEAAQVVEETRTLMSSLVGAQGPDSVVFTPSATIAANEIILGLEWNEYKSVYLTPFEHNAVARPLNFICKKYGITPQFIPFDSHTQGLNIDELRHAFAQNPPDYVFLNQVSNVTGTVVPVSTIAELAKEYSATVIVDGSQSVGLLPINLRTSNIDFLIFAGHKNLYASWGIGGFVANSSYPLRPVLAGGTGSDSLNLHMSSDFPAGFEMGSPNIIAIASLNESLKWLKQVTPEAIEKKKRDLISRLVDGLTRSGVSLYMPGNGVEHTSVVSFSVPGYEAGEIGTILNEDYDIAVRTGFHCAPYIHDLLGTREINGTVRASVGFFNTEADIDALIDAIAEIMRDPI